MKRPWVKTLWDILLPFSDYAFNRAHSAAYGVVSYWTAYLKANYPAEYMAAVLTSVRDDKDKAASTWPNAAGWHHGAFDSLGHPRKGLLLVHVDAIDAVMSTKKAASIGQFDLFGSMDGSGGADDPALGSVFDVKVPTEEWDARHLLAVEREMLGLYVSGHPLHGVEQVLSAKADTPIASILDGTVADGAQVTVGGILAAVNRRVNKNGESWASAQLEDLAGRIEVLVFTRRYQEIGVDVAEDAIVLVKARVNRRDDRVSLIVNDLVVPDLTQGGPGGVGRRSRSACAWSCAPRSGCRSSRTC